MYFTTKYYRMGMINWKKLKIIFNTGTKATVLMTWLKASFTSHIKNWKYLLIIICKAINSSTSLYYMQLLYLSTTTWTFDFQHKMLKKMGELSVCQYISFHCNTVNNLYALLDDTGAARNGFHCQLEPFCVLTSSHWVQSKSNVMQLECFSRRDTFFFLLLLFLAAFFMLSPL